MRLFHQLCWIFLWIFSVICVLCSAGPCSLQSFTQSSSFDENFDITRLSQSYDPGATVRVPCKTGFRSFFKLICTDDGWTYRGEKCQPISCGHPGDVPFADFALSQGSDYVFGSQVQYTCHPGYQMVSYSSTRNCLQGGWDGHLPVCEPRLCPAETVDMDKLMVNGDLDQAQSGSVVQFRCRSNKEELEGPAKIVCGDDGNWSSKPPTCRAIKCEKPELDNFVLEEEKTEYQFEDVLIYRCNNKYRKVDGRPSTCIKDGGGSGQWSPPPRCELKTCKVTPGRVGPTFSPANHFIFAPGEHVTATCPEDQWVRSREFQSVELTCLDTGEWNFSPICRLVTCDKNAANVRWWENNYYSHISNIHESVRYTCIRGYDKSPTGRATCRREGWDPNPLCKAKGCAKPSVNNAEITSNSKEIYEHLDTVHFQCTHDTSVTFMWQCYFGEWTSSARPARPCREKPCKTRPYIANGVIHGVQKAEYEHNEYLQAQCTDSHTYFNVTCKSGEWIIPNSCQVRCSKPIIKNGELLGPDFKHFDHNVKVKGRCTTGSKESFNMTCHSGHWTQMPSCPERSACGDPNIENGFGVEHENKVYYRCNADYKLLSKGWWGEAACVDGKWNTSDCIAKTDCGPIPHIPHLQSSERKSIPDGQNVSIVCTEGHISALETLTCNKGKWNASGVQFNQICTPIAKKCKSPPAIQDAVIMAPFNKEYLSNATLTYKCRDDRGETTIQCNNGTWRPDPQNISCT